MRFSHQAPRSRAVSTRAPATMAPILDGGEGDVAQGLPTLFHQRVGPFTDRSDAGEQLVVGAVVDA